MLPNAKVIQDGKGNGYKYLGVLEAAQIKQDEMRDSVWTEYFWRVKHVLRSLMNGGNTIGAINTWAVSLVQARIVKWRKYEL